MKKTVLFMLFALLCAVANAQSLSSSLIGSWQADFNVDKDEEVTISNSKMTCVLNRNSKGRLEITASSEAVEDGMAINMDFIITIPSDWTASNTAVYLELDIESAKANITKCTINGVEFNEMIPMLNDAMAESLKESMAAAIGGTLNLTKVTLAPNKRSFTCYSEGEKMTFYKKP